MTDDLMRVTLLATAMLEDIGVTYAIGGSVASSMYGEVRASQDVDIVADLHGGQVAELVRRCEGVFFIDEPSVREAIACRSSFNLIHLESALKVDVFVRAGPGTERAELARRVRQVILHDPERTAWFVTAEDVILQKLVWYHKTDLTSDRQWRDVLGVMKAQGSSLDGAYLEGEARRLGVADLLAKARANSGLGQ